MAEEEEDQEVMIKHVCKFCNKSFPCGRSLGGHMRSHVTNVTENCVAMKKKLSSSSSLNNEETVGYGLRENPKKTWRFTDSSGEDHHHNEKDAKFVVLDKLCKECGKGFQSSKALFGHMKCHSDKERVSKNNSFDRDDDDDDDQDSWKVMVVENNSQSDTTEEAATTTVPKRKKRSKRRRTRYTNFAAPCSNSVSVCVSVSEAELEQEEVALSLMMLSRDVSNWGGVNSNNSLYFEAPITDLVDKKIEGKKRVISNCSEVAKLTKSKDKKLEFGNSGSSILNSKGKSSKLLDIQSPGIENGKVKKPKLESEVNGEELVQSKSNNNYTSMKAMFFDSEHKSSSSCMKNSGGEFSKKSSNKRGKFECTTCKKKYNSYQALGGHRASHKRNKGCCFVSRNESSENTTELEESSEFMKSNDINEYVEGDHELEAVEKKTFFDDEKNKEHEVPIFVKRSHLGCESESGSIHIQSQTSMLQESVQETRSLLDLNLPAATEEESIGNHHAEPYKPWWMGLLAN